MVTQDTPSPVRRRVCFITIGATASFSALVKAAISPAFLHALRKHRYTDLLVQYGADGQGLFDECQSKVHSHMEPGGEQTILQAVSISGFPVDKQGLDSHLMKLKRNTSQHVDEGVIISHAGTGTILAAMRMNLPVIVVPNEELLDNHQVELAEALARQGYVVHGHVSDLSSALERSEKLRERLNGWPPVNSGKHRQTKSLQNVMDEEMGFLD